MFLFQVVPESRFETHLFVPAVPSNVSELCSAPSATSSDLAVLSNTVSLSGGLSSSLSSGLAGSLSSSLSSSAWQQLGGQPQLGSGLAPLSGPLAGRALTSSSPTSSLLDGGSVPAASGFSHYGQRAHPQPFYSWY